MKYYKISLLALVLGLGGCGAQKVVTQSNVAVVEQQVARPTTILFSDGSSTATDVPKVKSKVAERKIVHEQKPEQTAKTEPLLPRPKTTFSTVQSANIRVPGINPLPASGALSLDLSLLQEDFCYPYPGKVISNYGRRGRSTHTGVDIKAVPNDTIRSVMQGVVRMSKHYSGYGNVIVVQHDCGIETVYAHQSKNLVQPNDVVRTGQAIGLAGRTGRATTEHVHFEVRVAGEHIDPSKFLDYDRMALREGGLYIKNSGGKLIASNTKSGSIPMTDLQPAMQTATTTTGLTNDATASTNSVVTTPAASAKPAASTKPAATSSAAYHTVRRGDTLSAIARAYSTTVAALCKINNLNKDGVLSLGQRIKLK